ncbi:MAG: long-chain fatty acid--CoA ligase [Rhodospirillales bacterium]|nr:long-chain fatty acid--CoA ligase [Rhodospirillales bacterium]
MVTDYQTCTSLTAMFFEQVERFGDRPFLWAKREGAYRPLSWREVATDVLELASGLQQLGVEPGDRVMIVAENRPEWLIADIAIMSAGAVSVPAYTTNTVSDHLHILNNSCAKVVIVSTRQLAERVVAAAWQAAHPPIVISIEQLSLRQNNDLQIFGWDQALHMGSVNPGTVQDILKATRREDTCCLIYTSGTGGAPKGVMLSHGAILCNCMGAHDVLLELGLGDEVFLSFLPLSHAYEHSAGQFFPISVGAQIYYAEGVDTLVNNMAEARPTIMTAVPRLYELMRMRILRGVDRAGGFKARMFYKALELGTKRYEDPASLRLGERILDKLLDRLVRRKVAARFGGRLKAMVSGGAPLNYEVGVFFTALGVRILQGYGQTEAAPVISANRPSNIKHRTVGPPLTGVEVKIAEDGEILVRGELVMQGYWQDPEATANAIRDGWLHTGDIGLLDEDGCIQITDRKKDLIVNSGGDNVSPQRVEGFLTLQPEIAQAMAYGDRRPHLVALIVPDAEWAAEWAKAAGKDNHLEKLIDDPDFRRAIAAAVDRVNRDLSPIEKVRRYAMTAEAFSVVNHMLTPTLKIRRHKIREVFGERLERLYEERG